MTPVTQSKLSRATPEQQEKNSGTLKLKNFSKMNVKNQIGGARVEPETELMEMEESEPAAMTITKVKKSGGSNQGEHLEIFSLNNFEIFCQERRSTCPVCPPPAPPLPPTRPEPEPPPSPSLRLAARLVSRSPTTSRSLQVTVTALITLSQSFSLQEVAVRRFSGPGSRPRCPAPSTAGPGSRPSPAPPATASTTRTVSR